MGQAHRPPESNYKRHLEITDHAVERFRERVDEEFKSRSDWDLRNLLDERIHWSGERHEVIDLISGGLLTQMVKIEDRKGQVSYAVIRNKAVVSVLSEDQYQNNVQRGCYGAPCDHPPIPTIRNIGLKQRLIIDTGPKQRLVNPEAVAEALGAELVDPPLPIAIAEGTHPVPSSETIAARLASALLHLHRAERDVERYGEQVEAITRELDEALAKEPEST